MTFAHKALTINLKCQNTRSHFQFLKKYMNKMNQRINEIIQVDLNGLCGQQELHSPLILF